MADRTKSNTEDQPTPAQAARAAAQEQHEGEEGGEERFPADRLIAEAPGFLGVDSGTAAGAFFSLPRKNLTLDEAKAAVDEWGKTPVKQED